MDNSDSETGIFATPKSKMSSLGNIEHFNVNNPSGWEAYQERIDFYLTANDIGDEKKAAVFLTLCGPETYEILRSLIAPAKVKDISYEQIINALTSHFVPKTSEIIYRFQFYRRDQKPGESFSVFLKELRALAEKCNFSDLDIMLRDRIVCGVLDERLRRQLLSEDKITFRKAQEICVAYDVAAQSLSAMRCSQETIDNAKRETAGGATNKIIGDRPIRSERSSSRKKQSDDFSGRVRDGKNRKCFRCEGEHSPDSCAFINSKCFYCEKEGHVEKACFAKKRDRKPKRRVHNVEEDSENEHFEEVKVLQKDIKLDSVYNDVLNNVRTDKFGDKITVSVNVNGKSLQMEVDSGAAYSVIGRSTFKKVFGDQNLKINITNTVLRDYQKTLIPILGECDMQVRYKGKSAILPLIIVNSNRASLLGRNWFDPLGLSIAGIDQISPCVSYVSEYPDVFKMELGNYKGPPVSLDLDPVFKPIALKARKVPFALKDRIDKELDRLIEQNVLEPVSYPKWCTPIVVVTKSNGEVRICGDYRSTINRALRADRYPVPSVQNILATLADGKVFAKLDMAQAYLQLSVDKSAADAQTIITHRGAFRCNRLQFGVSVAPQIFQRFIDMRLAGISGVLPYYDDILIVGNSDRDLENKIRQVLTRFQEDGLHLRQDKCIFHAEKITFLGFEISAEGISPLKDKVNAIVNAPSPKNKTELQAFLGLINFYHIFLKNKATVAEPLHKLLHKDVPFHWGEEQNDAFQKLKNILACEPVLGHFDENKPLVLTCDASPYGVGCVLSQPNTKGIEVPIAYHSRTLSTSERNFAQIDREALSIVTGVKKFHDYIYGRHVIMKTDHKPLLGIFGKDKPIPEILSPRMLRWTILLNAYNYDLKYTPGKDLGNADGLSRLPLKVNAPEAPCSDDVFMLENIPEKIYCARQIAAETKKDPTLSKVLQWVWRGWPSENCKTDPEILPFLQRKHEITCYQDCLLWGTRVIIPPEGRKQILEILHSAHPGIVKMKGLARSYVWWPNLDKHIEEIVNSCQQCQESRKMPSKAPIHPWEWSRAPWQRIHIDHAGPMEGKYFLIVVDSYSKWLEVKQVPSTSTSSSVKVLRELFATHGVPDVCVSDNGSAFTAVEFKDFLRNNGIRQALVAPYHPSSNGQAERMVQSVKEALKKMVIDWSGKDLSIPLCRYLLTQHITPHTMTSKSPAEVLMGRRLNTLLDKVFPDFSKEMVTKQEGQIKLKPVRYFQENDPVYTRSYSTGPKWVPGTVVESTGPLSYKIATPDGKVLRRHTDQLRSRVLMDCENEEQSMLIPDIGNSEPNKFPDDRDGNQCVPEDGCGMSSSDIPESDQVRRSTRTRQPPTYLQDYRS